MKLSKQNIYGVTIQILNNSFYKDKFLKYKLSDKTITEFILQAKKIS